MCDKSESADVAVRVHTAAVVSFGNRCAPKSILIRNGGKIRSIVTWLNYINPIIWPRTKAPILRWSVFPPWPYLPDPHPYAPLGGRSIFPADGCALSHFNQLPHTGHQAGWPTPQISFLFFGFSTPNKKPHLIVCEFYSFVNLFWPMFSFVYSTLELCGKLFLKQSRVNCGEFKLPNYFDEMLPFKWRAWTMVG